MLRLLAIPLALVLLLAGALVYSGGAAEKRAELTFIHRGDINTLDTNSMSYMQDFRLMYGMREGLYGVEPDTLKPIPAGATGYDLSPDKKAWTFHLRKEAKWSNGDPVTAQDYIFSWRRMLEEPGEYTYLFKYITNAEPYGDAFSAGKPMKFDAVGVKAPDDYTLRVELRSPVPYLLELAAFPPFYPRNERSMEPFRIFVDSSTNGDDVMDVFLQYANAAKAGDADTFKRAVGKSDLNPVALASWIAFAKDKDMARSSQAELLAALKVFATLGVLSDAPRQSVEGDAMSGLSPRAKLDVMLATGFIRYNYSKAYTVPPAVVGNGPYNLTKWDFRRRLLLLKSDTYWDKAHVPTSSIEVQIVDNDNAKLLAYEGGEVEWLADIANDEAAELKTLGRTDLHSSPAFGTSFLSLLCSPQLPASLGGGKNPCADIRVRQALAMVIDKKFIVDNITRMDELPARTYLPPDGTLPAFFWQPGPADPPGTKPYVYKQMQQRLRSEDGLTGPGAGIPYNPQRARELLAEAGYPNGAGFPRLPILYNTENRQRRSICQLVKDVWKRELNIDIDIGQKETKIYQKQTHDKDYWICCAAWYGDYPDISTFTDKYLSTSLQNDAAWVNPKYDALCDAAINELDENKRIELLSKAENYIDTELPVIPLYHYVNLGLSRPNVHGVLPNPRGVTVFKGISVDKPAGRTKR
jgi:oligopeptide transport system substrate-binding protein